jgi:hypothetical protein
MEIQLYKEIMMLLFGVLSHHAHVQQAAAKAVHIEYEEMEAIITIKV